MNAPTLDLTSLRGAIAALADALSVIEDEPWLRAQPAPVRNTLTAGVIQSFEFVYELSFKMLRRRIDLDAQSPVEVDQASFRDVLRLAGEAGLVTDVAAWFRYRELRKITAHTYHQQKAREILGQIAAFLGASQTLLARLEARGG